MKIDNNILNPLSPKKSDGVYSTDKNVRSSESSRGATGKDKVEFSDTGRLLSKARASLEEIVDVRSDRVDELRGRVQSGTYQIPVEDLARKLIRLVQ